MAGVEDWHGIAWGINSPYGVFSSGMTNNFDYTAGTHVDRISGNMIEASKIGVALTEGEKVALSLEFGDGEMVVFSCSPARARQIAASLLNKADRVEGVR